MAFLLMMAAIHARFPKSGIIKHIQVVCHLEAQQFFSQWPDVVCTADDACNADVQLSMTFCEAETQNAFLAFSSSVNVLNSFHLPNIEKQFNTFQL